METQLFSWFFKGFGCQLVVFPTLCSHALKIGQVEDAIAHLCDELLLSGECVLIVNECLSQTKLAELHDDLATSTLRSLQNQPRNA